MLDRRSLGAAAALTCLIASAAVAEPKYGPGTSATEIKVGQTIAYSGPASAYGQLGKAEAAYFNAQRQRRHQRPQDHLHQPRRWLFAPEGGRECAQACRGATRSR